MDNNLTSMTPADGWYFIFDDTDSEKQFFYKIAVWKMDGLGSIYGMISIESTDDNTRQHLVIVPPNAKNGRYVHISEMSNAEIEKLGINIR